jgi:S-adenosylmethionine hydrolase
MPIITLLTDFGTSDGYVAEVKGVLVSRVADLTLVDISHEVRLGDVRAGQYLLGRTWSWFPSETVHLAIVDPDVGTTRRALAADWVGHRFVAPDNGLLSFLPAEARFVALPVPSDAAPTFHGRDVFAPAAAALATNAPLDSLGAIITDPQRTPVPEPRSEGRELIGEVVYVDRFGTLVSNIPAEVLAGSARIRVAGKEVRLRRTFADVARADLVAFVGSNETLEIAMRDGSAAAKLNARVGAEIRVQLKD